MTLLSGVDAVAPMCGHWRCSNTTGVNSAMWLEKVEETGILHLYQNVGRACST